MMNEMKPLIFRISNADKQHFMHKPVSPTVNESSNLTKVDDDSFLSKRTLLIPELVEIHPIPGKYICYFYGKLML